MDDFRSRLIDESMQLKDRLIKLRKFIGSKDIRNLEKLDRELLIRQQDIMSQYDGILEERLTRG